MGPTTVVDSVMDTVADTVAVTDTAATERGQLMPRPITAMDTAVDTVVMADMDTTATASKPRRPILNRSRNLSQPNFAFRQMQSSIIDCKPLCQIFKSRFAPMCLNSL